MAENQKIALVTGAGSGIGKAAAVSLAAAGFTLVLAGRKSILLAAVRDELLALAPARSHMAISADVTSVESVAALFAKVRETFGRLDVLFNNAGAFMPGTSLEEVTVEQWTSLIATNLTGAFLCTREAFRIMKDQDPRGGRIINNGSISAHVPRPGSAAYTASKHGATGLTRSTSLDGRKYNIACGQIDVGNAATEPTQQMKEGVPQANGTMAAEPTFDPAEVGRAVAYMAGLPLDVNVQFMTIMATRMPYIGRG
jgi:NAD(P)-dependent dehydrogenase (short-subunit alcohol dehydrogenase family)